ncbi:hypothetical protein M0I01_RS13010 [Providencia rettgeri]|nr:hypothetical protein [Providencia rettgeri]
MTEQYEYASIRVEMASDATLRDKFAMEAMNAIISTIPHPYSVMNEGDDDNYWLAQLAYKTADAMLKARG